MCKNTTEKRAKSKERHSRKTCKILRGMAYNLFYQALLLFHIVVDAFINLLFSAIWDGDKQTMPDLEKKHAILAESAVALAAKIRNKELKAEQLMQVCIERIKIVNPILNAVTDERFEDALKDAREVDKMIQNGLPDEYFKEKPFLGVPFTAKESHAVEGMLNTFGLISRRYTKASQDAECVRLLRAAGAIPVAVTNVPEINKWQETRNMLYGQTNNPYHCGRTTGGSSGGEAALHAALAQPIALCSDIGGSTRMPAFYCGLFGLNPTAGHTSLKGSVLRTGEAPTMASIGFVSRHCEDLAPLTKIVAGDKAGLLNLDRSVDIKDIKFFYTESAQDIRVSPVCTDLRKAMTRVLTHLTETAPSTDKAPKQYYHDGFNRMYDLWRHGMTKEVDSFPKLLANNNGEAKAIVELPKKLLGMSQFTLAAILKLADEQILPRVNKQWAEKLTAELKEDLISTLGSDGVLLFPSAPSAAPHHYSLLLRPYSFAYWALFNALHFPVIQVPLGLNSEGLPVGIQVAAAPRHDALCVAVARHLEKHFGGYVPPCNIRS